MKKTTCIMALCLSLAGSALAESYYTLGDVTYTTLNPSHSNHSGDRYSNVTTFTFTLMESLFEEDSATKTTASNGDTSYASTYDNKVALTSITLWEAGNQNTATIPGTLTITGTDGVSITSSSFTRLNDKRVSCIHDGGTWTFDFDGDNLLTVGNAYTVTFSSWNMAATNQGTDGFATMKGSSEWQPSNMTLVTTSVAVPEPATATLSLLALAGLAARRRRK